MQVQYLHWRCSVAQSHQDSRWERRLSCWCCTILSMKPSSAPSQLSTASFAFQLVWRRNRENPDQVKFACAHILLARIHLSSHKGLQRRLGSMISTGLPAMTREKGTTDLEGTTSSQMHHLTLSIWPRTTTVSGKDTWRNFLEFVIKFALWLGHAVYFLHVDFLYLQAMFLYKTKRIILTRLVHFKGVSPLLVKKELSPVIEFLAFQ